VRTTACVTAALGLTILVSGTAHAAIKLATWTMTTCAMCWASRSVRACPPEPRPTMPTCKSTRDRLGADVIAPQEVNGPKAAALVFPPDQYDLFFSGPYVEDRDR
jgi:hypothetical protein